MNPRTERTFRLEWVSLGAALLLLVCFLAYSLYRERAQIEALEGERLQGQARVIEDNMGRQLEGVANALGGVLANYTQWNSSTAGPAPTSRRLKILADAMPGVRAMAIFDAGGIARFASQDDLIGRDFSQRDYFRIPRERPDAATLYVSPPYVTVTGAYSVALSRAVLDVNGKFSGLVAAVLQPDYFSVLLRSVLYAPDMWTSLAHADGKVFLFEPPNEAALGKDLRRPGSFYTRHRDSGQSATLMTGTVYATGEERMMAQRTVLRADLGMDRDLGIGVSRDLAAIYAPWRAEAIRLVTVYALFALAALLSLFFFQRRRRVYDRLALQHESTRRQSEARLRLALEAAHMGTFERDTIRNRIVWSREHEALFGYASGEFAGTAEAFEERVHPEDLPGLRAEVARCVAARTPFAFEFRVLWPDGSEHWVASAGEFGFNDTGQVTQMRGVARDITERKRTEQEGRRRLEENQRQLDELLRWQELMVGREERMQELKAEVNELLARLGQPPRYSVEAATIKDDK